MDVHRRHLAALIAVACVVLPLAGCLNGDDDESARRAIPGHVLTIYSSLPATGPAATIADAVAAGQRQALAEAHDRAGPYRIRLIRLSSTKPGTGNWDPGQVSENASRAAKDPRAIAYLGELDLGASAISVPVTNGVGLLEVSPGDGLTSLTRRPPGRAAAGSERYYPSGRRTFLRLVPSDLDEADQIVGRMRTLGLSRPALIVGPGVYARELAGDVAARARAAGIDPVEAEDLREEPQATAEVARDLAEHEPDAVVLALARNAQTAPLLAALARTLPEARLITGSGVLTGEPLAAAPDNPFPLEAVAPRTPPPGAVLRRIVRRQGLASARPEALWGYESMRVALDAIVAAERGHGPARRAAVVRAALTPRVRQSPIGGYRVHASGGVTGLPLALYRLDGTSFEPVATLP